MEKIGIIAGRGLYPLLTARAAKRNGIKHLTIAAIRGDADPALSQVANNLEWLYPGQIEKAIRLFKRDNVENIIFAGQIKPTRLFTGLRPDFRALKLLAKLRFKNAESIFSAVASEFLKEDITVLPATKFLENSLTADGVIGKIKPTKRQLLDIEFGKRIATEVCKLDIGQTVVVKNGVILAVEAFEGTDEAIQRGGRLGKNGVIVVKISKPNQDMRFDVPCIGMRTVETLVAAKAKVIALEAGRTLLFEKETVISELNKAKIAVLGIRLGS